MATTNPLIGPIQKRINQINKKLFFYVFFLYIYNDFILFLNFLDTTQKYLQKINTDPFLLHKSFPVEHHVPASEKQTNFG